jgi:ankyrin repeat protein
MKVEKLRFLLLSCYSGDVQTFKVLLPMCKKAINGIGQISEDFHNWHNYSPLYVACNEGHVSVVEELVKAEADVNVQNKYVDAPLIAACRGGHVKIVEVLAKAGADVSVQGNTPLIVACRGKHLSVMEVLVKAGADVNVQDGWDVERNVPLTVACMGGHVGLVRELVKAEYDINMQDNYGDTPLITACMGGYLSIVEELVKMGADVNLHDRLGNSPLIAACTTGHASMVEKLVKVGADINRKDDKGITPLIALCKGGYERMVEELVKAGADINLSDSSGITPLIAAVRGSLSTVKCLVDLGALWVTDVVDIKKSAVYTALVLNKPDFVKYLVQEQNKMTPNKHGGNIHLFNCLVDIRHAGVKTDSRDDVVVTDRSVWCMDEWGDWWKTISEGDCDVLRHLLCVGLDVNQSIQLYDMYKDKSNVRPLLFTLVDELYYICKTEKVRVLLKVGADINIMVRYRENTSILDRNGMSVLERIKGMVNECSDWSIYEDRLPEYDKVMCEIKKHVRRHSV